MNKTNQEIKSAAKLAGVKLWQIADKLNINDGTFSKKLRKEFSEGEKARIKEIIKSLLKEGKDS